MSGRLLSLIFTMIGCGMSIGILRIVMPVKNRAKVFLVGSAFLLLVLIGYDNLGWIVVSVPQSQPCLT